MASVLLYEPLKNNKLGESVKMLQEDLNRSAHRSAAYDLSAVSVSDSNAQNSQESALFLQGPVGPFFSRVSAEFKERGFNVHKINFNGGDKLFFRQGNAVDYVGATEDWSNYLKHFAEKNAISRIYVFGDCRVYHRYAKQVAEALNIQFYVFEEGYLRPNYITLERGGVNGFSPTMNVPTPVGKFPAEVEKGQSLGRFCFVLSAIFSMMYYVAAFVYRARFRSYEHHRPLRIFSEGMRWIRSGCRKLISVSYTHLTLPTKRIV